MTAFTIPTTMQTPSFIGEGKVAFVEKPVPVPGTGELLIKVSANAICGSERGQFYGGSAVTPGHEAAGVVVAAGAGTSTLPGTHGVIYLMDFCGECPSCRLGFTNQCRQKHADMGFSHDGGYGPYELISEHIFFALEDDIPLTEATMLLDILGTGGHALRRAQLVRGDIASVAIAGAGPIGLGTLAMARILLGPDIPIYISDVTPFRLALARELAEFRSTCRGNPLPQPSAGSARTARILPSIPAVKLPRGRTASRRWRSGGCWSAWGMAKASLWRCPRN